MLSDIPLSRVEVYRVAVYDVSRARSTDHLLSFPACYRLLQIHPEKKWVRAESSHTPTPRHVVWYFLGPGFQGMLMIAAKLLPAASPRHNYLINQRIHSLLHNQHTLGHSITTPSEDDTINDLAEMVSISRTFIDYYQIPRGSRKRVESEVMILL